MIDTNNSAFEGLQKIYNQSIKKTLDLPAKTSNNLINTTFGAFSIINIVLKAYNSNGRKWKNIFQHDLNQEKHQKI